MTGQTMRVRKQFKCFFVIYLKLKGAKFLWLLPVILCLLCNNVLYIPVAQLIGIHNQEYTDVKTANDFVQNNEVLTQRDRFTNEVATIGAVLRELGTQKADPSQVFSSCHSPEDCSGQHFDLLYRGSSRYVSLVNFRKNESSILCNMAVGGELYCPFLGYLVDIGQLKSPTSSRRFKEIRMFRSLGRYQPADRHLGTDGQTLCDLESRYPSVLPSLVTAHSILTVGSLFFYFVASTMLCIFSLKGKGFLQMIVQKGLSVRAYWLVLWTVTTMEVLACAAIGTVSFAAQCPNFYLASILATIFGFYVVQFLCIAAICLLISVLARNYTHAGLLISLSALLAMLINLINRLLLRDRHWVKLTTLFVPPGHVAEFVQAALLSESTNTPLAFYHVLVFIVTGVLTLLLALLTLYLDFVLDTGNGLCLEATFVLNRRFWRTREADQKEAENFLEENFSPPEVVDQQPASVEPVKEHLRPVIHLVNLTKECSSGCCGGNRGATMIKNISVTMYENHITAIIGHNGAGKTTLMGILSGSQKPTGGKVYIEGCSLTEPLASLRFRGHFGICAQANTLSNSLTVMQSLKLTLVSVGCYPDESETELLGILNLLRLNEKLHNFVGTLSRGQKRKLCIALALLGNPKVLVLDEPTSGVDPVSRRRIWKLLQEYRLGRAIILSTHFMDEADTLADRKVLLSGGSLICAGSSQFLKNIFDCGFIFEVTLKAPKFIPLFLKRMNEEFSTVRLRKQLGTSLELKVSAHELEVLPSFAAFLEKRMDAITAYGLAQPTLADIFVRLKDMTPSEVEDLFETKTVGLLASDVAVAEKLTALISQPRNVLDKLETRALSPSTQKRLSAMLFMNIRRTIRTRTRLFLRLIIPALLLAALICAVVVEHLTRNRHSYRRQAVHYRDLAFSKGVCVYDYPSSKDNTTPTPVDCYRLLNAASASASVEGFLVMHKEQVTSISSFMEKEIVMKRLKQACGAAEDGSVLPCPVFHTDVWSPGVENLEREVNIGMYSDIGISNVSTIASTVMSVYARCMQYFGSSSNGGLVRIRVETVDDFRTTLLPLFGAFVQIIVLAIVPASYLEDVVEDKESKVRCQLYSMGVTSNNYWVATFIVHWLHYAAVYIISLVLLIGIQPYHYLSHLYLVGIAIPTLFLGLSNNVLCAYVVSTFLDRFHQLSRVVYVFLSLAISVSVLAVQLNSTTGLIAIYILPPFASIALTFYGTRLEYFASAYYWIDDAQKPTSLSTYFAHPHLYNCLIAMLCHTVLLIMMLCLTDQRNQVILRCKALCQSQDDVTYPRSEDPGVVDEIERLERCHQSEENIMELRHIRKIYPHGVKAVRDVTFGVLSGGIFGLLGPNGAGKTSTLSIIVGDEKATSGQCEIRSKNGWIKSSRAAQRGAVGYCPQHNPLFPSVTIVEHLRFYAKILGIHEGLANHDIGLLVQGLGLENYQNTQVGSLSKGLKRRTCLAISLLGNPSIVVIDEAFTGVDPEGKRFIWSVIRSMASLHRAIIVTTHSMEEVEALCTRVGIMNHGLLVGLGTISELLSLYGEWYTLDIQVKAEIGEQPNIVRSRKDRAIKAIVLHFSHSKILEQFTSRVTFSIPSESVPRLSAALSWLVSNKESLQLRYFSFYQLSLDQVFEYILKTHDDQIQKQRHMSVFSVATQLSEFDNTAFT